MPETAAPLQKSFSFAALPLNEKLILAILAVALVISVVTDLREKKILNVVTLPALAMIFVLDVLLGGMPHLMSSLIGVAACAGPFLIAALPGWMGMGDVKLMAVVGAALGWPFGVLALLVITMAGGAQAIAWIVAARIRGREKPKYVPYAVAIAAGTVASFLVAGTVV